MTQEWDSIGVFKAVASGQVRVDEVLSVDIEGSTGAADFLKTKRSSQP